MTNKDPRNANQIFKSKIMVIMIMAQQASTLFQFTVFVSISKQYMTFQLCWFNVDCHHQDNFYSAKDMTKTILKGTLTTVTWVKCEIRAFWDSASIIQSSPLQYCQVVHSIKLDCHEKLIWLPNLEVLAGNARSSWSWHLEQPGMIIIHCRSGDKWWDIVRAEGAI